MKKYFNRIILFVLCLVITGTQSLAAEKNKKDVLWSVRIAESFLNRNSKLIMYDTSATEQKWFYEQGLMLEAMKQMFFYTGEDKYYDYIKQNIEKMIGEDGSIKSYRVDEFNIDQITPGRAVLYLYQVTGEKKYKIAVDTLRHQLALHPRTKSNGFWHKQIYPNQMWLDGLYMGEPFYSEYSREFDRTKDFDDIAHQFELIYEKAHDAKTGLLYHAWDESKQQKWANPETGLSPNFWGRSIGWYIMALVDVLETFPQDHPKREMLINQLREVCDAVLKFRDKKTNAWYQIVDQGNRKGNYLEASASSMFTYAFAKGYNKGYLDKRYMLEAQLSFAGLIKQFVMVDKNGLVNLNHVCSVAGLGGNPYRDGSFEYYIGEKQRTNDFKGYGPFLLAAIEIEKAQKNPGSGMKVALDNYFNNETRKNKTTGKDEKYHYIISDTTNSGFSDLANIFKTYGAKISELKSAPTAKDLKPFSVYIIVDPDTPTETPSPKFIEDKDIAAITEWVKGGGVLVFFANDKGNCEFEHLNNLVKEFGWHFNEVSSNRVEGNNYNMGAFTKLPVHPIFSSVNKIYMKEISTITVDSPQHIILKKDNDAAIAFKKYGNGAVLAIGDPWLYNEYISHRRLPADFENTKAAENLVDWLLELVFVINHSK